mgnify:CR=1 FL=1
MSSVKESINKYDPVKEMEKYYDGIIENLRLNLQVAEGRIRRLQDSEFKLECEIETLKEEITGLKKIN